MALTPGTHHIGTDNGSLVVKTFREGMAAKVGHDLVIDVTSWEGSATVADDGSLALLMLDADSRSLRVREGLRGVKPLTDKDRAEIVRTIDDKILRGEPISFRCRDVRVEEPGARFVAHGELIIVGTMRGTDAEVRVGDDGHVTSTVPVKQTDFGIKPYRGLMGALKVRDDVEVVVEARLPVGA